MQTWSAERLSRIIDEVFSGSFLVDDEWLHGHSSKWRRGCEGAEGAGYLDLRALDEKFCEHLPDMLPCFYHCVLFRPCLLDWFTTFLRYCLDRMRDALSTAGSDVVWELRLDVVSRVLLSHAR